MFKEQEHFESNDSSKLHKVVNVNHRYILDASYIEKKRLQPLWSVGITAIVLCLMAWSVYQYNAGDGQTQSVMIGVLAALLAFNIYRNIRISKNWSKMAPQFALSIDEEMLTFHSSESHLNVPLNTIEYMKATKSAKQVIRILIKSNTGPKSLIEGFESMNDIAERLEQYLGPDKVK